MAKHGMTGTGIYNSWQGMKARCYRPGATGYTRYGGRGIIVCERWLNSFENFLEDMKDGWFQGASLDRKENNGNYEKGNCRWSSKSFNSTKGNNEYYAKKAANRWLGTY